MTQAGSNASDGGFAAIGLGIVAAVVAGAIFVVLTAASGTTYHLFPLLIGFVPGGLPRVLTERPISRRDAIIAVVAGIAVVGAAWLVLELLEEMPSATLLDDQPGGVGAELLLSGALGALTGAWWGSRPA